MEPCLSFVTAANILIPTHSIQCIQGGGCAVAIKIGAVIDLDGFSTAVLALSFD